jgi:BON domain
MNFSSLITAPARLGLTLGARAFGFVREHLGGRPRVEDNILQRNVEAEVMASRRAPKGKIEIDVTEGVVWLRGEVRSRAAIEELESRASSVDGVARVENLLRVAKPAKTQKRPAPKRSSRPKPPAATAPPPKAEPTSTP